MRINVHTHIFNLRAVLTRKTVEIIARRLIKHSAAEFFREPVSSFLHEQVLRPEYLSEEAITRRVVSRVVARDDFQAFLQERADTLPLDVRMLASTSIEHLGTEALNGLTHKLTSLLRSDEPDEAETDLYDILAMLHLAGRSQIREVAEALLSVIGPDDVIVALMLDLGHPDDTGPELDAFHYQLRATSETSLVFPGRVLPFVSVHPDRPDHMALLDRAVNSMGFVGVKLYPSLGYSIEVATRRELYAYCVAQDLPILVHCNEGGFFWSEDAIGNCKPSLWRAILTEFPSLRICFAHCGGDDYLAQTDIGDDCWTQMILGLMDEFPGVYADIAFHTAPMSGGAAETNYFRNLRAILAHDTRGSRMLFGSDAWLVRQRVSEENYWKYFRERLTENEFRALTETNPQRFLGLPRDGQTAVGRNIGRHLDFLVGNRDKLWAPPSRWVQDAVKARYPTEAITFRTTGSSQWSANNQAHQRVYWHLHRNQFTSAQKPLRFDEAGRLALYELDYWVKGRVSDEEFGRRCGTVARGLGRYCRDSGATFEVGFDESRVAEALTEVFKDGTAKLSDLGAVVDTLFRFTTEA